MSHRVADSSEDENGGFPLDTIFTPARPPSPEPTIAVYENLESLNVENPHHHGYRHDNPSPPQWSTISVRLVGRHPLWGHYLWTVARALARFLQRNPEIYAGQTVFELGAGCGLPGLLAAKCGAQKVVLTDCLDEALVENLSSTSSATWRNTADPDARPHTLFDLVLLSDRIFNHYQNRALLTSCELATAPGGCVLVSYTHHRPHLAQRDMAFFDMARECGWKCEKRLMERFPPMLREDPGKEEVRSVVHGWRVT